MATEKLRCSACTLVTLARAAAIKKLGRAMAIRIRMMAMTIKSSMRVNPGVEARLLACMRFSSGRGVGGVGTLARDR